MASKIEIPLTLQLSQLKKLAVQCGIASSGTKPILATRLNDELALRRWKNERPTRILSIDMGIRNLAYCVINVPGVNSQDLPSILAWRRLAISSPPKTSSLSQNASSSEDDSPAAKAMRKDAEKESFHPSALAAHAYKLLNTNLLSLKPTHILLEQQRFRSASSSAILEWTIRVNTLEAVLYGILHTLTATGQWQGEVISIAPSRVGPFWVGETPAIDESTDEPDSENKKSKKKSRKSATAKIRNKGAKMDLVKDWLETSSMVSLGSEESQAMAIAYLKRYYKSSWKDSPMGMKLKEQSKRVKGSPEVEDASMTGTDGTVEKMGKLDDLADSLLQGMGWLEWEKNKEILRREGYESLLSRPTPGQM